MRTFIFRTEQWFERNFPRLWRLFSPYKMYILYLCSGGFAAFVDIGLIFIFTEYVGWWYLLSAIVAFCIAVIVSFVLQKFVTFRDFETSRKMVARQSVVYLLVSLANLGLNTLLMYLFVDKAGLHYVVAQIVAGGLIAISSFLIYRRLIFKQDSQSVI